MSNDEKVKYLIDSHKEVIGLFFKNLLIGCNGEKHSILYYNPVNDEIGIDVKPKSKTPSAMPNNPSALRLDFDGGWAMGLTEQEKKFYQENSTSLALRDYINQYIKPTLKQALVNQERTTECKN